jgi:hypothetical protein
VAKSQRIVKDSTDQSTEGKTPVDCTFDNRRESSVDHRHGMEKGVNDGPYAYPLRVESQREIADTTPVIHTVKNNSFAPPPGEAAGRKKA